MNLRQLDAFRAVMESGTVSRAAKRLSVSQPAVSKLIQSLEQAIGLVLFEPSTFGRALHLVHSRLACAASA